MTKNQCYKFSVAPMMDWTDRHCRTFHRCLTQNARLWTEMVTADAVIHGDRDRLIGYSPAEHPIVLQLGGSDPHKMAEAARIGQAYGYDEVNINCGCPSDRVQSGSFGACLMAEPKTVADCVSAMGEAVTIPVTVKCRIAIDDLPARETLFGFVEQVADAGCSVFTIHARKAWLKGLSPKENRDIPPLDYDLVADLKAMRPDLTIVLNGGLQDLDTCKTELNRFDGVMLGRAAYQTPALLADVDRVLFGDDTQTDVFKALDAYRPYMAAELARGTRLHAMTRHMLGLFAGRPGARAYRRHISEHATQPGSDLAVLDAAVEQVIDAERRSAAA
ncbi:MAG: tRNA dihydrouridine(20/20a) synthase DusA [Pseudomonadota bacterium]